MFRAIAKAAPAALKSSLFSYQNSISQLDYFRQAKAVCFTGL